MDFSDQDDQATRMCMDFLEDDNDQHQRYSNSWDLDFSDVDTSTDLLSNSFSECNSGSQIFLWRKACSVLVAMPQCPPHHSFAQMISFLKQAWRISHQMKVCIFVFIRQKYQIEKENCLKQILIWKRPCWQAKSHPNCARELRHPSNLINFVRAPK